MNAADLMATLSDMEPDTVIRNMRGEPIRMVGSNGFVAFADDQPRPPLVITVDPDADPVKVAQTVAKALLTWDHGDRRLP